MKNEEIKDAELKAAELTMLKMWRQHHVEQVFKYKHRLRMYRGEGRESLTLFFDMTSGRMFQDVKDVANYGHDVGPEDCLSDIDELITAREEIPSRITEIAGQKISYYFSENPDLAMDDTDVEYVKELLREGYQAGELCQYYHNDYTGEEREYRGWWRIEE